MVGAQRQLLGGVFAVGSGVEGKFEVAGLADEKAVGGQDGAVGIGDGEAEFAGAILRAGERGDKQEKKCGVDQGTAQRDSPRSAGGLGDILQRTRATAVGRERYYFREGEAAVLAARGASAVRIRPCLQALRPEIDDGLLQEQAARMLTVRTVMAITFSCEIRIPIPGLGGRGDHDGEAVGAGKTATVRMCTPTRRRCK